MKFRRSKPTRQPLMPAAKLRPNYYGGRKLEEQPKNPKAKLSFKTLLNRLYDLLIGLTIIGLIVYALLITPNAKIDNNNSIFHSNADYKKAADAFLKSFKNRTKLTFDEKGIVSSLQKQYPEITSATAELSLLSERPVLHLHIDNPSFLFTSHGSNYVVNSQGIVVAKAGSLPLAKNLPPIDDQSGFSVALQKQVLSSDVVNFINNILAQAKNSHIAVSSMTLPTQAQELDLRTADRSYFVKFYLGGDSSLQAGQWLAARHQFDKNNSQPSEYLDVRVEGKIYYK